MLKRFPQAALWRWPRPGLFGFSVCDISLTLLRAERTNVAQNGTSIQLS